MAYLALDLSKRSAGWALWHAGLDRPVCGTWELGSELTSAGLAFLRLHQRMNEIHTVTPLADVRWEQPLLLGMGHASSSPETQYVLMGLAAHADSFCEAKGIRRRGAVPAVTWRRHFLGKLPRGTRTPALKQLALDGCRALGIEPHRHDAAEAVGILDHALFLAGVAVPWRKPAGGELFEQGRAVA